MTEQLDLVKQTPNLTEYIAPHLTLWDPGKEETPWFQASDAELTAPALVWAQYPLETTAMRVCLFGPAGAGKTHCLQEARRHWLEAGLKQIDAGEVPRLIPLWVTPKLATPEDVEDPIHLVLSILKPKWYELSQKLVRDLYQSKRFVFLLDSLHEQPGESLLAQALSPACHWLLSCRPGFLKTAPAAWTCYRIEGFDHQQQRALFDLVVTDPDTRRDLAHEVGNRRMDYLYNIPHLWRIALEIGVTGQAIHGIGGEADLYKKYVDVLLQRQYRTWDHNPETTALYLELMGFLAFNRPGAQVARKLFKEKLWENGTVGGLSELEVDRFLADLPRFFQPVPGDDQQLAFVHGNLATYLAAAFLFRHHAPVWSVLGFTQTHRDLRRFLLELEVAALREGGETEAVLSAVKERVVEEADLLWDQSKTAYLEWLVRSGDQVLAVGLEALGGKLSGQNRTLIRQVRTYLFRRDPGLLTSLGRGLDGQVQKRVLDRDSQSREARKRAMGNKRKWVERKLKIRDPRLDNLWPWLMETRNDYEKVKIINAIGVHGGAEDAVGLLDFLADGNGFVRGAAARALGLLGNVTVIGPLAELLQDPDDVVVSEVINALGFLNAVALLPEILDKARSRDPFHRSSVARTAGLLADAQSVPVLMRLAQDHNKVVRGTAARSLGQLGDVQACNVLMRLLDSRVEDDPMNRGAAAKALGQLGDVRACGALMNLLDPRVEDDPMNRGAAATALGQLGDVRACDALMKLLEPGVEPGPKVRGSAATALGQLGDARACDALMKLLEPGVEPGSIVRGSAATALGQLGDARACDALMKLLEPGVESGSMVRGSAATALGQLGDVRACDALMKLLEPGVEPGPNVRGSAATALGQLGDVRACGALMNLLDPRVEDDPMNRGAAATALGQLGDVRACDALMKLLEPGVEPGPDVRGSAATALGLIGLACKSRDSHLASIQAALENHRDPDPDVDSGLRFALVRLKRYHRPPNAEDDRKLHEVGMKAFARAALTPGRVALIQRIRAAVMDLGAQHGVLPKAKHQKEQYKERHYQNFLRGILGASGFEVVLAEGEVKARDRTDFVVAWHQEAAVIELKLKGNHTREDHLLQVNRYLESLPRHQGVLLVLNQDDEAPTEMLLQERVDGIEVFELYVNRRHASALRASKA